MVFTMLVERLNFGESSRSVASIKANLAILDFGF